MSWDEQAGTWDDDPAVRAYSSAAFRSLSQALQDRGLSLDGAHVVDFGCGTGLLTESIAPAAERVVALDVSPAMIDVLRQKAIPNVHALCASLGDVAGAPPLLEASFGVVVCSSVCAFLEDYPTTARLLASLLAPGGVFLQWDWELDPAADEPFGLTREAIAAALQGAGLEEISVDVAFEVAFEGHVMAPLLGVGRKP